MVEVPGLIVQLIIQAGVAAVLHKGLYLVGKFNPAGHHRGGPTHTSSGNNDLAVGPVLGDQLFRPFTDIVAFGPPVADVLSLTMAVRPGIRKQDVITELVVHCRVGSHILFPAHEAMQDNHTPRG